MSKLYPTRDNCVPTPDVKVAGIAGIFVALAIAAYLLISSGNFTVNIGKLIGIVAVQESGVSMVATGNLILIFLGVLAVVIGVGFIISRFR